MERVPAEQIEYPGDGLYYSQDRPFTGVGVRTAKEGWIRSEIEYKDGLRWGKSHEWYGPEHPKVDAAYFKGVLHGRAREWHRNGQVAEDGEYEYGITLWERHWDEGGVLTRDYQLKEEDPDHATLVRYRALYASDGGDPPPA